MRILLLHPNYHSGGAEIAGNWPPAWVAYLTGYLKAAGYTDVHFVDAMTHHLSDEQVRARIEELQPDVVGCTAITPAIYKACFSWPRHSSPAWSPCWAASTAPSCTRRC